MGGDCGRLMSRIGGDRLLALLDIFCSLILYNGLPAVFLLIFREYFRVFSARSAREKVSRNIIRGWKTGNSKQQLLFLTFHFWCVRIN